MAKRTLTKNQLLSGITLDEAVAEISDMLDAPVTEEEKQDMLDAIDMLKEEKELITITSIKAGYKKVVNGIDEAAEETGLAKDTILKHINSDMIAGYKFTK